MNAESATASKWTPAHWWMLALMTITSAFVAGIQMSCMPPLFKEISDDLGLDIVQVGSIWGFSSLAGIVMSILSGVLSDKFGTRRVIIALCFLGGITGALRGVTDSFITLLLVVLLNGAFRTMVPVVVTKETGVWFRGPRLGFAMGISAMGMGLGLMLGPLLSATVLSPWLGSWRSVMYFLGGVSVLVGFLWWFTAREPAHDRESRPSLPGISIKTAVSELARVRSIWMIGFILFFRAGCMLGLNGYVPIYLRDYLGWSESLADGPLTAFYAMSTLFVIPLAHFSDRMKSRKIVLVPAAFTAIFSVGLMPFLDGAGVWAAMIITGLFMDGFMSLAVTMSMEAPGIKPEYSGIALGMLMTLGQLGSVISPPLGNWLAELFDPGAPFYFWAAFSLLSFLLLLRYRPVRHPHQL